MSDFEPGLLFFGLNFTQDNAPQINLHRLDASTGSASGNQILGQVREKPSSSARKGVTSQMAVPDALKNFPFFSLLLSGTLATITKTILQKRLIPDNVDWLTATGMIVAFIAFLFVFAHTFKKKAKAMAWLLTPGLIALLVLIFMQIQLVEKFVIYDHDYHELRGWTLSAQGRTMKANLEKDFGRELSLHDVIKYSGYDDMYPLFGQNWNLSQGIYAVSFLYLLFAIITVAGLFEKNSDTKEAEAVKNKSRAAGAD